MTAHYVCMTTHSCEWAIVFFLCLCLDSMKSLDMHHNSLSARPYQSSVKYARASPAEMPFQTWYTANIKHFRLTDFYQPEIKNTTMLSNKPSTA